MSVCPAFCLVFRPVFFFVFCPVLSQLYSIMSLFAQFWFVQCIGQLILPQLNFDQLWSTQLFRPVFTCLISLWTAGILVCFCFTPNIFCPMLHSSALLSSAQTSSTPVPFPPVLTCPISCWTAGIFICFCFIPILSNARLDRSKWTKRDIQLRSAQTSSAQQNSAQFSSKMSIF